MNFIILEKNSAIRAKAREGLKGKWKIAILLIIISEIFLSVIPTILQNSFTANGYNVDIFDWISLLLVGVFNYGLALCFLNIRRRCEISVSQLFNGFSIYFKTLWLYLYMSIFIVLWTLLFIVPGIIAALRYSMSYNVMVDHPEYTIRECVNESKRIMDGNIGKLFLLYLSFIGWGLLISAAIYLIIKLASLPFVDTSIVSNYAFVNEMLDILEIKLVKVDLLQWVTVIITTVLISPLSAYVLAANCTFYDMLNGRQEAKGIMSDEYDSMSISEREEFIKKL